MYIINTWTIYLTFVITRHLVILDLFMLYFFYLGGGSCRRYGGDVGRWAKRAGLGFLRNLAYDQKMPTDLGRTPYTPEILHTKNGHNTF